MRRVRKILLLLTIFILLSLNAFAADESIDIHENIEYTSTEVSVNNGKYEIITEVYDKAIGNTVIVALYQDNRTAYVKSYLATAELTSISTTPNSDFDTVKVFVWGSLKTLRPVCSIHNKNDSCEHNFTTTYQDATCYSSAKYKKTCSKCGYSSYESVSPVTMSIDLEKSSYPVIGSNYETGHTYYYTVSADGGNGNYTYKFTVINNDGSKQEQASYSNSNKFNFVYYSTCRLQVNVKDDKGNLAIYTYNAGDVELIASYSSPIDVIDHSYDVCDITKEATCTEDGIKSYTCNMCKLPQIEKIPATGHSYSETVTPKDCSSNAIISHLCSICEYTYDSVIPDISISIFQDSRTSSTANGYGNHSRGYEITASGGYGDKLYKYEVFSSSTSTTPLLTSDFEDGNHYTIQYTGYYSKIDNYVLQITAKDEMNNESTYRFLLNNTSVIEYSVAKIEHTVGVWNTTTEPTCVEQGVKTTNCVQCGKIMIDNIPAKGHDYREEDDICNDCGELISYTDGLSYTLINNDTEYEVSGIGEATDTDIVIPRTYNAKPVTRIGMDAFEDCKTVKSVRIPSSVTHIRKWAFAYSGISKITIPSSVIKIESYAFSGCKNIFETVDNVSYIDNWAIDCKEDVTNVTLREGTVGIGGSTFFDCVNLTSVIIPDSLVTIGENAFYNCSNLNNITIPNKVSNIESGAFYKCSSLNKVNITDVGAWCNISFGDSNYSNPLYYAKTLYLNNELVKKLVIPNGTTCINESAFVGCSIVEVSIPESVTTIESYAFNGCNGLVNITIPKNVTYIGYNAFKDCTKLIEVYNQSKINIKKGTTYNGNIAYNALNVYTPTDGKSNVDIINGYIFYSDESKTYLMGYSGNSKNLVLPDYYNGKTYNLYKYAFENVDDITSVIVSGKIVKIEESAFSNCDSLQTLILQDGVTSMDNYAFANCSKLENVYVSSTVSEIGYEAFGNCVNLKSVTLPENLKSISANAFKGCSSLEEISIPKGVQEIGFSAFENCIKLKNITMPENLTTLGSSAFRGCQSLTKLEIPNGVTKIETMTFYECSSLEEISLPDGITSIGQASFYMCDNLRVIELPSELISLDGSAFSRCVSIEKIVIPKNVTTLGASAYSGYLFSGCTNLKEVIFEGNAIVDIPRSTFENCISLTKIVVPEGVLYISNYAFSGCSNLTDVTIPQSAYMIMDYAFNECTKLKNITYNGTKSMWEIVHIGSKWDVNTGNYIIHCTDEDISKQ